MSQPFQRTHPEYASPAPASSTSRQRGSTGRRLLSVVSALLAFLATWCGLVLASEVYTSVGVDPFTDDAGERRTVFAVGLAVLLVAALLWAFSAGASGLGPWLGALAAVAIAVAITWDPQAAADAAEHIPSVPSTGSQETMIVAAQPLPWATLGCALLAAGMGSSVARRMGARRVRATHPR